MKPGLLLLPCCAIFALAGEPLKPATELRPFAADNLDRFATWLKDSGPGDPKRVFSIQDGVLRVSGEDRGYLATREAYRDYQLTVEYMWGTRTDGGKYVRNSGILIHGVGPHGGAKGVWMTCLEVQLAQGCEGDFIVIRGKDDRGETIPATLTSNTRIAGDRKTRWDPEGKPTQYSGRQFWWRDHQPGFKELLDTRGTNDVASPLGQWTRVECLCRGNRVTVKINGVTVNEAYDVFPAAGRILLQNEGHEVFFRNLVIRPLRDE